MRGSEDERERSGMVGSTAETSGLSDKTEFTETKDQGAMHHMDMVTTVRVRLRARCARDPHWQ